MSRISYIDEFEYLARDGSVIPNMGMDSTTPLQGLRPGYVRQALNAHPGLVSGWTKRDGFSTQLSSVWTGRSITGGIEYKSSGARSTILFGTDGADGVIGAVAAGAVSDIETGLSATARPCFVQLGDLLCFVNGADAPVIYDGSTTRQMGITAPAAAPTIVLGSGGSLTTNASYIWAYTYYNSVTGAESSPSALSATTATGANTKGTLTVLAGDSDTADTIRIWRTVANGQTLFLDGTAAIGATSYESTKADSALTATLMELDNTRITTWSGTPNFSVVNDNRVFLRTGRNEARHSKHGQSGPMYESFEASAFIDTTGTYGSADDIIGHAKAGTRTICLKERSVGVYEPIGIPSLNSAVDTVRYQYRELSSTVDPVSHYAAVEVNGECIFLTRSNIYGTRGQEGDLRALADTIQATIRACDFAPSKITKISSVNDTKNQRIYFSIFYSSSETVPRYQIVGDYRMYPQFRWSFYGPGTAPATHPGLRIGCFIPVTNASDGTQDILFGNIDTNGQLYKMHSGTSDNGSGIHFELVTRPYAMRSIAATKLFKKAPIYVQGSGAVYSLSVSSIYDMSGAPTSTTTFSLSSGGAVWDNALWDVDIWNSDEVRPRDYQTHRKARHQQLVFQQTEAAAPITLFGWGVSGSAFRI